MQTKYNQLIDTWKAAFKDAVALRKHSKHTKFKVGAFLIVDDPDSEFMCGYNMAHPYLSVEDEPSVHAEIAAMISAGSATTGATIFITHPPCHRCCVAMATMRIGCIVFLSGSEKFMTSHGESSVNGLLVLEKCGIDWLEVTDHGLVED
jgi:tRNA(Arg) A34 adenosine deaminase TadA